MKGRIMNFEECLQEALNIKKNDPELFRNWYDQTLAIWIRDGFKCVYCEEPMLQSSLVMDHASNLDHIVPRQPHLVIDDPWNLVLACRRCNNLKRSWNPAEHLGILEPNEKDRDELLTTAKIRVAEKREEREDRFRKQKPILTKYLPQ
jgi:hypothetical protein